MLRFRDRHDAGQRLAIALRGYANRPGVLVLALPRGGVPVGFEVASALGVPLDVFVVRKLGVPGREELAMGAIAGSDVRETPDPFGAVGAWYDDFLQTSDNEVRQLLEASATLSERLSD